MLDIWNLMYNLRFIYKYNYIFLNHIFSFTCKMVNHRTFKNKINDRTIGSALFSNWVINYYVLETVMTISLIEK